MPSNSLRELLQQRHSCRAFLPNAVPPDVIADMLEIAQLTASWCNVQPWGVYVTSGAETDRVRALLMEGGGLSASPDIPFPERYSGVYRERRQETAAALYDSVGIAMGDRIASARQAQENFRLFGAPHLALITTPAELGPYGILDCGAYVGNLLLSAESLGVAAIAQAAIAMHSETLRRHFDLPAGRQVLCGVSFGYEDKRHPVNGFRTRRVGVQEACLRKG